MKHNNGHIIMRYIGIFRNFSAVLLAGMLVASCGEDKAGTNAGEGTSAAGDAPEVTASEQGDASSDKVGTYGPLVYGDPNAPIEIVEYASLTCPHCATFALTQYPQLKEKYIDTGKVKMVYKNFLLNQIDLAASTVARCRTPEFAKKMHDILFRTQRQWATAQNPADGIAAIARKAGMSRVEFDRCLQNRDMQLHLAKMRDVASKKFKVNATPTIFVDGEKVDIPTFEKIEEALADKLD